MRIYQIFIHTFEAESLGYNYIEIFRFTLQCLSSMISRTNELPYSKRVLELCGMTPESSRPLILALHVLEFQSDPITVSPVSTFESFCSQRMNGILNCTLKH